MFASGQAVLAEYPDRLLALLPVAPLAPDGEPLGPAREPAERGGAAGRGQITVAR